MEKNYNNMRISLLHIYQCTIEVEDVPRLSSQQYDAALIVLQKRKLQAPQLLSYPRYRHHDQIKVGWISIR